MRLYSKVIILAVISSCQIFSGPAYCEEYDPTNFEDGSLTELGKTELQRQKNWGSLKNDPGTQQLMNEIDKSGENTWINSLIKVKMEHQNLEPWKTKGNVLLQFENNNAVLELTSNAQQPAEIAQMLKLGNTAHSINFESHIAKSSPAGRIEVSIREVALGATPILLGTYSLSNSPKRVSCPIKIPQSIAAKRHPRIHTSRPFYDITIKLVGENNQVRLDNFKISY